LSKSRIRGIYEETKKAKRGCLAFFLRERRDEERGRKEA
jgi:hypothetical protein